MRATRLATVALMLLVFQAAVGAADFDEYARLQDRAIVLFETVQGDDVARSTREAAVAAYLDVIEWLDRFFADPEFETLSGEQQAAAYSDRYRWEYNLSRQLMLLDRCEEARDRIRRLLDSFVSDPELRPRLAEAFEEAHECLSRPRVATLSVDVRPADAEVILDGVFIGDATALLEIPVGEHTGILRADGYEDAIFAVEVESEGQRVTVGPFDLVALADVDEAGRKMPTWYEWTLWGAGAVGIGTGIILLVDAASSQDTLDSPPEGLVPADPAGAQDDIDTQRAIGYVVGGLGLACAVTATVLYLVRDVEPGSPAERVSWGAGPTATGAQAWVGLRF